MHEDILARNREQARKKRQLTEEDDQIRVQVGSSGIRRVQVGSSDKRPAKGEGPAWRQPESVQNEEGKQWKQRERRENRLRGDHPRTRTVERCTRGKPPR